MSVTIFGGFDYILLEFFEYAIKCVEIRVVHAIVHDNVLGACITACTHWNALMRGISVFVGLRTVQFEACEHCTLPDRVRKIWVNNNSKVWGCKI
jgi:hypothetical protein